MQSTPSNIKIIKLIPTNRTIKDEGKVTKQSNMVKVINPFLFPFNYTVRITCFKGLSFIKSTGVIIDRRTILTCAHNISEYPNKKQTHPDRIEIEIITSENEKNRTFEVKSFKINEKYLERSKLDKQSKTIDQPHQIYDLMQLTLYEKDAFEEYSSLQIMTHYNFEQHKDAEVLIIGFPDTKDSITRQTSLYYSQRKVKYSRNGFLFYDHTTYVGSSGSPIILKIIQVNQSGLISYVYKLIGLHKGQFGCLNCGILLSENHLFLLNSLIQNANQEQQITQKVISSEGQEILKQKKYTNVKSKSQSLRQSQKQLSKSNNLLRERNKKVIQHKDQLKKQNNQFIQEKLEYKNIVQFSGSNVNSQIISNSTINASNFIAPGATITMKPPGYYQQKYRKR